MRMRAVSPVVATALLIIIAVATAVVLYLWVSGMVSSTPTSQTKLQEAIRIEAVDVTNKQITAVYIRNVGDVPATIDAIYVIDATTGQVINSANNIGATINPGNLYLYTYDVPVDVSQYTSVIVKAVTSNGIEATYLVVVR
ncbi:archaellin/type IV pilin N-terminal domain-containing protein [Hyperthermus butylicus]|nr:archaellin/type IV pilin N-terminal domain-containing protein [Hyperthermus butylicus]